RRGPAGVGRARAGSGAGGSGAGGCRARSGARARGRRGRRLADPRGAGVGDPSADLQRRLADLDDVPGRKPGRALDLLAVDERAVGRAEVGDVEPTLVRARNLGVAPRDLLVALEGAEALGRPANDELAVELGLLAPSGALGDFDLLSSHERGQPNRSRRSIGMKSVCARAQRLSGAPGPL